MRILYLDDSGKIHPNDSTAVAVFAGFSVDENRWHRLIRQITGAKAKHLPARGNDDPNAWEVKSGDFLPLNSWLRAKNRRFCFEIVDILERNACKIYCVSLEKSKAKDDLSEEKFIPLCLSRLISKFYDEL
ncbi:MAG: hypothetical protein K8T89_00925, partial [Planctomycetes bacterium]|nr:hypothetical protein [Planctomycetota bacterium]